MHKIRSRWHKVPNVYLGWVIISFRRANDHSITTKVAKFDFLILFLEWQKLRKRDISQENIRDDYSLNMLIKLFGLQGNKCTRCKRSQYEKETARGGRFSKDFLILKRIKLLIKHSMQVCNVFSRVLYSSMVHHVFIWWSALSFLGLSERTI